MTTTHLALVELSGPRGTEERLAQEQHRHDEEEPGGGALGRGHLDLAGLFEGQRRRLRAVPAEALAPASVDREERTRPGEQGSLEGPPFRSQAQDYGPAKWSLGDRSRGVADADVDRAMAEGAILRTHMLRPTWHFVLPRDIRWMQELTAPRVHAQNAYYYRQTGLDDGVRQKARRLVVDALLQRRERPADRFEFGERRCVRSHCR